MKPLNSRERLDEYGIAGHVRPKNRKRLCPVCRKVYYSRQGLKYHKCVGREVE